MKNNIFLITCLLSILLISCEKEVDVEIKDNDPKIVLSAHIGAGDSLKCYVSSSIPLYATNNGQIKVIEDAVVEVSSDNITWKTLHYNPFYYSYSLSLIDFSPSEGQTYYIRASANGFKSVNSSCTIPFYNPVDVTLVKIDTTDNSGMGNYMIGITIKVKDAIGQRNYYGIQAFLNEQEFYLENNTNWIFSDNIGDGSEFIFKYTHWYWHHGDVIKIRLLQSDESFYRFHYSFDNYISDDPFTEPSPVFSNIENGLGICSGYTSRDYTFVIP